MMMIKKAFCINNFFHQSIPVLSSHFPRNKDRIDCYKEIVNEQTSILSSSYVRLSLKLSCIKYLLIQEHGQAVLVVA